MRILDSLSAAEKSTSDLARELQLHRATLRYHLGHLRDQGLIEEVTPAGPRRVGRPASVYRASKHAQVPGYPQRRFDLLGQMALEALVEAVGVEKASGLLEARGFEAGRALIAQATARAAVGRWTPEAFERVVLSGVFKEFGIATEVLSRSARRLEYRAFGCPFLELAETKPDLVCNSLDLGFHRGIDEALGGVTTARLACMGHGDPYCQYRLTWGARRGPRPLRSARGAERPK